MWRLLAYAYRSRGHKSIGLDLSARMYHFTGTQHGLGGLPQNRQHSAAGALGLHDPNVIEYTPLQRAALVNMGIGSRTVSEPPSSNHARIDDGSAVTRDSVLDRIDRLPNEITPDRLKLWVIRTLNIGDRETEGVGTYQPVEGAAHPRLVTAVDHDGNEIIGVRLPDITQPAATHAGWNVRDPRTG